MEDTTTTDLDGELVQALPRLRAHLAGTRGLAGTGGDVDDLAQEAAARALRARERFDAGRGLWPWLRRIADRVRLDAWRRGAAAPEARPDLDPLDPATDAGAAGDRLGAAAAAVDAREDALRVVAGLPPRERDVLLRFHVDGQPVAAIAADLGLPEGTVKSSLSRARRRLAEWHEGGAGDA